MLTNMVDIIGTSRTALKEGILDFSPVEPVTLLTIVGVVTVIGNKTGSV